MEAKQSTLHAGVMGGVIGAWQTGCINIGKTTSVRAKRTGVLYGRRNKNDK